MGFAQGFAPPKASPAPGMTVTVVSLGAGGGQVSKAQTQENPTFTLTVS